MAPPVPKLVGATPPWIQLQRGSSESAAPSATVLPWPPKEQKLDEPEAALEVADVTTPAPDATDAPEDIVDLSDG